MESDMIVPGVGVGGVMDKYEIKLLICYLLESVKDPLTREQLNIIFHGDQYVNYFSFCDALQELLDSGHLKPQEQGHEEVFILQPLGKETAHRLSRSLPISLRDNVVASAMRLMTRLRVERENEVDIFPYQNGYMVRCIVHDVDFDMLRMEIFAPDEVQAETLRVCFLEDPSRIYRGLMGLLLKENIEALEVTGLEN